MKIPPNLMNEIVFFCESQNLGLMEIGNENFRIILMETKDLSPDQISIIAANALLEGVIQGHATIANEAAKEEQKKEKVN